MKRFLVILVAVLLYSGLSYAQQRSAEQAAEIAAAFVNGQPALRNAHRAPQTAGTMRLAHTRQKASSSENAFYVFNRADNAGFIIVSADERTEVDILGYSDKGQFNFETANPSFRFWLERYQEEISSIQDDDASAQPRMAVSEEVEPIAPLLVNQDGVEITWYQETPYSDLCPLDKYDNTRCYTGCVATAAAQVMCKWRHPLQGEGTHTYVWQNANKSSQRETLTVNYGETTYDWDNMLPAYAGVSYTTAQANAVATLMYHAGVACDMNYGGDAAGGSGALTDYMAYGLAHYFRYDYEKFITMYSKSTYPAKSGVTAEYNVTASKFKEYFNADLEAGRPIIMGGESWYDGGHEFVCDGRDKDNKFHINWGWEGDDNGYFAITALKPSGYNFSNNLDAIIGLAPVSQEAVETVVTAPKVTKILVNGQVIIVRDGVQYNIMGQPVK